MCREIHAETVGIGFRLLQCLKRSYEVESKVKLNGAIPDSVFGFLDAYNSSEIAPF